MDKCILKPAVMHEDFEKIDLRVGTVLSAEPNVKARKPAYILRIDFGPAGVLESSAQLTANYTVESLIGRQVVAVVNFPVKRIAGFKSLCLVLGAISESKGVVLLEPNLPVENGTPIG